MHELPITQEVVRIACEEAAKAGAKRIKEINLVVGEMSGVVDDSVKFYFNLLTENTMAAGAQLNFRRLPMLVRCVECNHEFHPDGDSYNWECPQCHQWLVNIIQGKEFYIDNLEVE